jgi:hypothetical protein
MASAEQAPGGHGESSGRAWSKLQEGSKLQEVTEKNREGVVEEKHLLDAQEIPPWQGRVVPVRPQWHQARGSRRWHISESPNSPSTRSCQGQGQAARDQARGCHGQDPELRRWRGCERLEKQSTRSHGQEESPSLDLLIGHHLSDRLRRSSSELSAAAVRRCSRQREREGEDDAGEQGGATGRADRATWSGSTR